MFCERRSIAGEEDLRRSPAARARESLRRICSWWKEEEERKGGEGVPLVDFMNYDRSN